MSVRLPFVERVAESGGSTNCVTNSTYRWQWASGDGLVIVRRLVLSGRAAAASPAETTLLGHTITGGSGLSVGGTVGASNPSSFNLTPDELRNMTDLKSFFTSVETDASTGSVHAVLDCNPFSYPGFPGLVFDRSGDELVFTIPEDISTAVSALHLTLLGVRVVGV